MLVAALLAGSGVAAAAWPSSFDEGAAVARMAARTDPGQPPTRAVFISDSALAGLRWTGNLGRLTGTNWNAYLESCRRLVYTSCRGREGYRPRTADAEIGALVAREGLASKDEVLIIGVGYNDWESRFRDDFTTVTTHGLQAGFGQVIWLTYRTDVGYTLPGDVQARVTNYAAMNAIMREELASGRWPNVSLWEYGAATAGHPDWFTYDGVHLTTTGAPFVAEWLSAQIRISRF